MLAGGAVDVCWGGVGGNPSLEFILETMCKRLGSRTGLQKGRP